MTLKALKIKSFKALQMYDPKLTEARYFLAYGERMLKTKGCCHFYHEMDNHALLPNLGAKCHEFDIQQ